MWRLSRTRSIPVEYYVLQNVSGRGPVVGVLADVPIPGTVIDGRGKLYRYAGLAPRDRDGRLDVAALRSGEWIVQPGLVYAAEDAAQASL